MLAIQLAVPPPPMQGVALTIAREPADAPPVETRSGIDLRAYLYEPGNSVTVEMERNSPVEEPTITYQPRTQLGRRLLSLRRSYLDHGGKLLSADALDAEMRVRRGGLGDA